MASFDYDVVIVGSGFGGSVAALRAAEKGYRVGVMESGKRWNDEDIPKSQWHLPGFLWFPAAGLYGIYQGVPRSAWGADSAAVPSRITIFRGTIEQHHLTPEAIRAKVIETVHHEIAHHFGISDARLAELSRKARPRPTHRATDAR